VMGGDVVILFALGLFPAKRSAEKNAQEESSQPRTTSRSVGNLNARNY